MPTETTLFRLFWSFVALAWMAAECKLAVKTNSRQENIQMLAEDSEKKLWLTLIAAILIALCFKSQLWMPIPLAYTSRQFSGFTIFCIGILLRYTAIKTLGSLFSTRLRLVSYHQVCMTGPYRMVRHPSYTGLLLALSGIGIALGDVLSLLVLWLLPFVALNRRIAKEETLMLNQAGLAYRQYCQKTWKLFPWVY